MKILAISGSYRKGKTIDILIDKAVEGIRQVDPSIEVEKISLIDKNIKYCTSCMSCRNDDPDLPLAKCSINDDMQEIYNKMLDADGYIFGTPVNCGHVTAVLKTFIERSIWIFAKPGTSPLKGCPAPRTNKKRSAMFLISAGIVPPVLRMFCDDASKLLKDYLESSFHIKITGDIYAGAVEKRGTSYYFDQAVKNGRKLAKSLQS
ncbi:MAG: flavodoxin family protein [Candidatus Omnitrophica bacterium]|nr:flavodoxin family protein [Candidatus Omnitrophota bacterium]